MRYLLLLCLALLLAISTAVPVTGAGNAFVALEDFEESAPRVKRQWGWGPWWGYRPWMGYRPWGWRPYYGGPFYGPWGWG